MQKYQNLHSRRLQLLAFGLLIIPAATLGVLILKYGVNVLFWDQWSIADTIIKAFEGKLTFSDLIAQHNESRKFFPRLIWIALAYLTHYDVRYEMLLSFLFACVTSVNIFWLSKLTVDGNSIKIVLLGFLANCIIFSPVQYEAWFMGPSSVVFISIACITTCFVIAYSPLKARTKFLVCGILSTISTYSFANGMLSWLVVLPVLALSKSREELINKKWLFLGWFLGFTANVSLYFYNYHKPPTHPHFSETLVHPFQGVLYLLGFLGNQFAWGTGLNSLMVASIVGLFFLSIWIFLWIYFLRFFKDGNLRERMFSWIMLGTYAILSAIIATSGRLGFGVQQSLSSRYTTFSGYLVVAIIYLIAIVNDDDKIHRFYSNPKPIATRTKQLLITIMTILYILDYGYAIRQMSNWQRVRLQGKTCLVFVNVAPDEDCLKKLFPTGATGIQPVANALNQLGLLEVHLATSNRLQDIHKSRGANSTNYGAFETLNKTGETLYKLSGWAILPEKRKAADAVILTYDDEKGDDTVFKVVEVKRSSYNIAKTFKNLAYSYSGWRQTLSAVKLPVGLHKIRAWAFDAITGRAFQLTGTHAIQNKSAQ